MHRCVVEDLAESMMTEVAEACRQQDHLSHGPGSKQSCSKGRSRGLTAAPSALSTNGHMIQPRCRCTTAPVRPASRRVAMIVRWWMGVKRNGSWFKGDRTGDQDQKGRSAKTDIKGSSELMSKCELAGTGRTMAAVCRESHRGRRRRCL